LDKNSFLLILDIQTTHRFGTNIIVGTPFHEYEDKNLIAKIYYQTSGVNILIGREIYSKMSKGLTH
jgi:hypothetical protein